MSVSMFKYNTERVPIGGRGKQKTKPRKRSFKGQIKQKTRQAKGTVQRRGKQVIRTRKGFDLGPSKR